MAYDSARDVVVLFGGETNDDFAGDTWEWDGVNWTQVGTASISMAANVFIGLAEIGGSNTSTANVAFDSVVASVGPNWLGKTSRPKVKNMPISATMASRDAGVGAGYPRDCSRWQPSRGRPAPQCHRKEELWH